MYLRYPPAPLRWVLPRETIWQLPDSGSKDVALSFDDGPDPKTTPQLLDILKSFEVKATFFCTGAKLSANPELHEQMLQEGHIIANHGFEHFDGWTTRSSSYIENAEEGAAICQSTLFRPPYGRIRTGQASLLSKKYSLVMWSLLSGDFDTRNSPAACLNILTRHTKPGDIVVFHDSKKAAHNLFLSLPPYVKFLKENSYLFKVL